ncbi:maltose ABC transporter permease MalF [Pelomonas sp. KK5]|uniref:maltose ABC transporter permease MalF n=1 Tax=Pelomonas sp. KK5 TaxID=1855730 RepID=UPI0018E92DE0|nr:maltose ABC transporter permease MalF [Pelomonas sp. KK5]
MIAGALALLASLALVIVMFSMRLNLAGGLTLAMLAAAAFVYVHPRFYAWRYVVPGILAVLVFIVLPMGYTLAIAFTNYSLQHLLPYERSTSVLLSRMHSASTGGLDFKLFDAGGGQYKLVFVDEEDKRFATPPLKLIEREQKVALAESADAPDEDSALPLKDVIRLQPALKLLTVQQPDGVELKLSSLRRFTPSRPQYTLNKDGSMTDDEDGKRLVANMKTGYWEKEPSEAGGKPQPVEPGFRTYVGWQNYTRIFTDARFFQPFARVFAWTVSFASLNTLFTFGIGILLATAMNWDALRFRNAYRLMLFLPYAVPAFISIPVFRGLFNENLGEINLVLDQVFGIRPSWFSDAATARSMVLIVNAWLGYPYMMILCMGLIKAIPGELYEASALAGAGPFTNFFRITLPLIARPIAPLLITSFAFNFNNLALIALLTNGAPDYLDTEVPVGATDLLASYTYRMAFHDSGQNYALACAISSIVFLIVAGLAVVNLKLFKVGKEEAR